MVLSFYNLDGATSMGTYINGTPSGNVALPSPTIFRNFNRIFVGGDMDIGEFTIYNEPADVTLVDIVTEIDRLKAKYNIT
jgi:hypothetical protein